MEQSTTLSMRQRPRTLLAAARMLAQKQSQERLLRSAGLSAVEGGLQGRLRACAGLESGMEASRLNNRIGYVAERHVIVLACLIRLLAEDTAPVA